MRTVFSNANEVIHLFAQRTQDNARSSNTFFNGNKIYSYGHHYLLGEFIENKKGETAIVINDKGYSSTTSSHISSMTMASRQYLQFFKKQIDLDLVLWEIENNAMKLKTARKKEKYIDPSNLLFEKLNEYILWSGKSEIKKDLRYKKIVALFDVFSGGEYEKYLADNKKRLIADQKKKEKERIKKHNIQIEKFYNYEVDRLYNCEEDLLRLSQDGEFVETSQNIKVAIKEAKILYLLIASKKDIVGFKIADYTVISINGTLKIGCHRINIDSVHKIGNLLIEKSEE